MQQRSATIAAFAICSFSNPGSLAVIVGALSAMAPDRHVAIAKVALRAFIAGCIVSFITASIAGMLLTDELIILMEDDDVNMGNHTVDRLF